MNLECNANFWVLSDLSLYSFLTQVLFCYWDCEDSRLVLAVKMFIYERKTLIEMVKLAKNFWYLMLKTLKGQLNWNKLCSESHLAEYSLIIPYR